MVNIGFLSSNLLKFGYYLIIGLFAAWTVFMALCPVTWLMPRNIRFSYLKRRGIEPYGTARKRSGISLLLMPCKFWQISSDVKQYIKKMRSRDSELNASWGIICTLTLWPKVPQIQLFEDKKVHTAWENQVEKRYFSLVDVCMVLTACLVLSLTGNL